jgi:hypothetical protein
MKCILSGWSIALCLLSFGFLPQVKAVLVEETGVDGSVQSINRSYATGSPATGDTIGRVAFTAEASGTVTTYTQITSSVAGTGVGQMRINVKTASGLVNIAQFTSAGLSLPAGMVYSGDASLLYYLNMSAASYGILSVLYGGTGLSSVAQGSLLVGSGSNTLSTLPKDTLATRYLSNQGTNNDPKWDQVNLGNGVAGILPIERGGTNNDSAFSSQSIVYSNGSQLTQDSGFQWDYTNDRLHIGTNNAQHLGGLNVGSGPLVLAPSNVNDLPTIYGGACGMTVGYNGSEGFISARYLDPQLSIDQPLNINTSEVKIKNTIKLMNLTSAPGTPASGAILYSVGGELYAKDTSGNATINSPHNFELFQPAADDPAPWSFYSENTMTGKVVNVDMSGAMRELERLSGKKFVYYADMPTSETENYKTWMTRAKDDMTSRRKQLELAAHPYEIIEPDADGKLPARVFMQVEITSTVTGLETKTIKVLDAKKMCVVTKTVTVRPQKQVGIGQFKTVLKPGWEFRDDGKLYRARTLDEITAPEVQEADVKLPDWVLTRAKARAQKEKQAAEK